MTNKNEFNLSKTHPLYLRGTWFYEQSEIKEFIRRLKEDLFDWVDNSEEDCAVINTIIDKLAGDELI